MCVAHRPVLVLTPAGSTPWAEVPCGTFASAGTQQPTQNWCGPRHDKLGVGITQESHKKLWYEFAMRSQGHSKHQEGKVDRGEEQGGRTGE
jgi:hypothetical protein